METRTAHGFTLIEVLIALAVIGIGLLAVLAVAARSGKVDAGLQQRAFANWVAANEIARLRLSPKWPSVGESNGRVGLAHKLWKWDATVEGTPDRDLRRITVTVAPASAPKATIARLVGFVGKPASQPVGFPTGGTTPHHPNKKGGG